MRRTWVQIAVALALVGPASAADLYTPEPIPAITEPGGFEARWEFGTAVYLWMAGLDGTTGIGELPPVNVDLSFSDILDDLDFAVMALGEARYGRFGIFGDLIYTNLSTGGSGPGGALQASLSFQELIGTLMAEYRVVEQGKTSVDIMGGARIWGLQGDFTVNVNVGDGPDAGTSGSGEKYWVDPMIGVKSRVQGASPWYLTGWAMIGGFGAAADIDWDLFGGVGYEFNDRFSMIAGYRAIGVDYDSDDFQFDIIQKGPVLGGVFRF